MSVLRMLQLQTGRLYVSGSPSILIRGLARYSQIQPPSEDGVKFVRSAREQLFGFRMLVLVHQLIIEVMTEWFFPQTTMTEKPLWRW